MNTARLLTLLTGAALISAFASAETAPLQIKQGATALTIQSGDKMLMRYVFGNVPFKPYAKEFTTPAGVNPLLDAPPDHLHHHALMFAIQVDDVNFWEEIATSGKEVHQSFSGVGADTKDGVSTAGFTEKLTWLDTAQKPMADETRKIIVYMIPNLGASLLTWQTQLSVPNGKDSMVLGGHHYFGLGMRFVRSMDKVGAFINSSGQPGEIVRGEERLVPALWNAYSADADGKPVTAAMFDDPKNPRHPATWFTMAKDFAYQSATLNLMKEPMTVTKDAPLTVRYGVALFDGKVDKAAIERVYQRWLTVIGEK